MDAPKVVEILVMPTEEPSFVPDTTWTRTLPRRKLLDCVSVAKEVFTLANRKLSDVERTGLERKKIRVAAFIPRLPDAEVDRGCRRYSSYMGKKFREHGIDFRVEEAHSAELLELALMGAQVNDKILGTFIFFPTPFGKTEDYFLRRVRPEKDIEGLTVENTGRMALNIKTVDEEEEYEGVVPCTARAILTLLHRHDSIKSMFPQNARQLGPTAVIFNGSSRIGIPLQSMLMRIGATAVIVHPTTRPEHRRYFHKGADIVVTAFPARCEQDLIRDIKPGAVVIDWSTEGNLHPDVAEKAAYFSTHDNHLGQITTALALYNTARCALWQRSMNR
jgi:methylenetetrahydrofolate dehydrogenase (NADP+)/methenyltetrahydrofolate cyclohydrolase